MKVQDDRHPRRADAQRNIEAILTAAGRCLAQDPDASVGAIAASAGVGRVTLYGHFPNRAHLVDAVVTRALAAFQDALESVDLSGDPHDALVRLVHAVWQPTAESARLIVAAERALPPERILDAHQQPMRQVTAFIERGQARRAFRTDLPASWLVSVFH